MLINEVAKTCDVTKKAIDYYVEQGLIFPNVLENGYRDFPKAEIEKLRQISLYRKLGLSIAEIKGVLVDPQELKDILYQRRLELEKEKERQSLLRRLCEGESLEDLEAEINHIDSQFIIISKLMDLFPSYYGKFISVNFSRYLTGTIETKEQMQAFKDIIDFFDDVPDIVIPADLQEYMDSYLEYYFSEDGVKAIHSMVDAKEQSIEDIDSFVEQNREVLKQYREYRNSKEYKESPAYRLMELMKEICVFNGYNEKFIPAMRRLSPVYNSYYEKLLKANEVFCEKYSEYLWEE